MWILIYFMLVRHQSANFVLVTCISIKLPLFCRVSYLWLKSSWFSQTTHQHWDTTFHNSQGFGFPYGVYFGNWECELINFHYPSHLLRTTHKMCTEKHRNASYTWYTHLNICYNYLPCWQPQQEKVALASTRTECHTD